MQSVDRPLTECWPITDRYISQVSTNYRRSVGERKAILAETHLEWLSTAISTDISVDITHSKQDPNTVH